MKVKVKGRVWKFGDNINTDLIYPADGFRLPIEELIKICFRANRPGWVDQVQPGDVIVGGVNFGTGSARDGAGVLKALRIGGVIADSINGVFFRNSVNCGFPIIECPNVSSAFKESEMAEFDLEEGIVTNLTTGKVLQGFKIPPKLANLIAQGGNEAILKKEGYID
jgi:3-isopropylmalate/(R)-2-methylmalate dehydratase small subunit